MRPYHHETPAPETRAGGQDTAQHSPILLRMREVVKVYVTARTTAATRALDGMSLDVSRGEFISVMGPSGSGKTTLLNLLAGLDRPTSGELWLQGQNMAALGARQLALFRRRQLGFVFQDFNLLDTLTLAENVALPLSLEGKDAKQIQRQVSETIRFLGLEDLMGRYPYEVSGGQQQRASVARAVVHQPHLLLADEPTGNLDSASARALLELFQRLNTQQQATILMVTHDPFSASYSQRVVFIKDGRVFTSLQRVGGQRDFFQRVLATLSQLEGAHDLA